MLWVYLFLINFTKGGCIKCNILLITKGNKMYFLRWIIKVMNVMGIFVSYQFHERGLYQM